jgi:preprotein translocase subunit SecF
MKPNEAPTQHKFFSVLPSIPSIPFMKYRKIAYVISAVLILSTVGWLVVKGPRYSVDFTGGMLLQVQTVQALPTDEVRSLLDAVGYGGAELQAVGDGRELMIRLPIQDANALPADSVIIAGMAAKFPGSIPDLRRAESVGPRIGAELREKALWAILFSLAGMLLYVGLRYEFKFALGGVMAIFHDVFAAFGVLLFMQREISLTVVAALLTLAGYSVNDTIVVFDRIKERGKQLHKLSHEEVMNTAMNETLSRTLITSTTVFLATLSLYIWGGEVINDFALCMLVGVIFGTYSSIYVASALALDIWLWLDRKKGVARKAQAA